MPRRAAAVRAAKAIEIIDLATTSESSSGGEEEQKDEALPPHRRPPRPTTATASHPASNAQGWKTRAAPLLPARPPSAAASAPRKRGAIRGSADVAAPDARRKVKAEASEVAPAARAGGRLVRKRVEDSPEWKPRARELEDSDSEEEGTAGLVGDKGRVGQGGEVKVERMQVLEGGVGREEIVLEEEAEEIEDDDMDTHTPPAKRARSLTYPVPLGSQQQQQQQQQQQSQRGFVPLFGSQSSVLLGSGSQRCSQDMSQSRGSPTPSAPSSQPSLSQSQMLRNLLHPTPHNPSSQQGNPPSHCGPPQASAVGNQAVPASHPAASAAHQATQGVGRSGGSGSFPPGCIPKPSKLSLLDYLKPRGGGSISSAAAAPIQPSTNPLGPTQASSGAATRAGRSVRKGMGAGHVHPGTQPTQPGSSASHGRDGSAELWVGDLDDDLDCVIVEALAPARGAVNKAMGSRGVGGVGGASRLDASAGQAGMGRDGCDGHSGGRTQMWVEKYTPTCEEELAVAKKKVQEIKGWMQYQLPGSRRGGVGRMLLLSGPCGCGKSTTVKVLAQAMGFNVVEWRPQAPVLWSELQYQGGTRDPLAPTYTSKLDEFELFVNRAKFLGAPQLPQPTQPAPMAAQGGTQVLPGAHPSQTGPRAAPPTLSSGSLILLDDLPHTHDYDSRCRLSDALCLLAATARGPVVVITTETSGASGGGGGGEGGGNAATGSHKGLHKDILEALQDWGVGCIALNPLTTPNVTKVLLAAAESEGRPLSEAAATSVAAMAGGDLRAAMQTLQLMFGQGGEGEEEEGCPQVQGGPTRKRKPGRGKTSGATTATTTTTTTRGRGRGRAGTKGGACGGGREIRDYEARRVAATQRDQGLDLFHALGKILYNKRDGAPAGAGGGGAGSDEEGGEGEADFLPAPTQAARARGTQGGGRRARGAGTKAAAAAAAMESIRGVAAQSVAAQPAWAACGGGDDADVPERHRRPPMKCDPETILSKSGLDPMTVTSFLHENYLNFIGEDALEDMIEAAGYFSDAAFMACHRSHTAGYKGFWGEEDSTAQDLVGACAASVATRGLMYVNTHPAPRRWTPLQGPVIGTVDRARSANMATLSSVAHRMGVMQGTSLGSSCGADIATQVLPWVRQLAASPAYSGLSCLLPDSWSYFWQGKVTEHRGDKGCVTDTTLLEQLGNMDLGTNGDEDPVEF